MFRFTTQPYIITIILLKSITTLLVIKTLPSLLGVHGRSSLCTLHHNWPFDWSWFRHDVPARHRRGQPFLQPPAWSSHGHSLLWLWPWHHGPCTAHPADDWPTSLGRQGHWHLKLMSTLTLTLYLQAPSSASQEWSLQLPFLRSSTGLFLYQKGNVHWFWAK